MSTLTLDRDEIVRLAALATGDEKHEASSYSTLDALLVLYGRVLQVDPADPAWEQRDRFILSKGHGPAAYYAVLCLARLLPRALASHLHPAGQPPGQPSRPPAGAGRRGLHRLARPRPAAGRRRRPRPACQGRRPEGRCPDRRRRAERGLELGGDHAGAPAPARKPHACSSSTTAPAPSIWFPSTSAWPSSAGTPSRSTAATTPPSRPRSAPATTRQPPSLRP